MTKRKKSSTGFAITFKVSPRESMLIAKAARTRNLKEQPYMRQAVLAQAERDIADRTEFQIPAKDMKSFLATLDRPVQERPRLQRLLNKDSILD